MRGPGRRSSATRRTGRSCSSGSAPIRRAAAARASRPARARPAGAQRRALRREHAGRPRPTSRGSARCWPTRAGLDHRARRARQDAARPCPRARRRAAGRARRRAGRRHRGGGRRRRGRLRARRPRLGRRAAGADAGAAPRPPRPDRAAAGQGAEPAGARQLRAPGRRGGRAGGLPRLDDRELRVLTTSRAPLAIAAEHVYLLGSSSRPTRPRCSATARSPRARESELPDGARAEHRHPARRPAAGDRARRGEGPRDGRRGDRPAARGPLRAAARRRPLRAGPPPDAARRDRLVVEPARRAPNGARCAGWRCSTTGSRSRPPTRCSATAPSMRSRGSSTSRC